MSDEPGLPATDEEKAALLVRMVEAALDADTADGSANLRTVMLELRAADPEAVQRLATALQLRGVGRNRSTAH